MQEQSSAVGAPTTTEQQREDRPCRLCRATGLVVEDASYDASTGELVQTMTLCPICGGGGRQSVFMYRSGS